MSGAFDFVGGHHLREIRADEVAIGVPFTERERIVPASMVVIVSYGHPNREVAAVLDDGTRPMHRIGDITGTNGILAAIHQAAAVARSI